ncbi:MAG: DUF167 domain-containing protein [Candidatus Magasanikbacteria bacterium]|nr:DUF167 domain-containing protein [Candidatus Magasanikbacteria bacterium]
MKIFIKAKPSAYEEKVEKIDETHFVVAVKEPPQNGLANKGICRALAKYFGVSQSMVVVKKGFTSKNKVVEII